jgi:hypothetical protein
VDVGRPSLIATFAAIALSLAYYYIFLRRRGGWLLCGPENEPAGADELRT